MRLIKHIVLLLLILSNGAIFSSCERVEPDVYSDDGKVLNSFSSERLVILDTINWEFVKQTGNIVFFENNSAISMPAKGDYIAFHSSNYSVFGRFVGKYDQNGWIGLEIELVPMNDIFDFLVYRDTLESTEPDHQTILNQDASQNGDTLMIENYELLINDGQIVIGSVAIDSLFLYEQAYGEVFFYLTPEWEQGTLTKDIKVEWNQDLSFRGQLEYFAYSRDELRDSMLIKTRIFSSEVLGFPISIEIEDWLVFEWQIPGTNKIKSRFDLSGESKFAARYELGSNWILSNTDDFYSKELSLDGWDHLESGYIHLGLKTICRPVFCGLSDFRIEKNLGLSIDAVADWPSWQTVGGMDHVSEMITGTSVFRDIGSDSYQGVPTGIQLFDESGALENESPIAIISMSPGTGFTNTDFKINANLSTDKEDPTSELEVRWDFEGDGEWDTGFSKEKALRYTYETPGTYSLKLEVMDTQGAVSDTSKNVVVYQPSSAPIATFTISPETGEQSDHFTFDASGCYDAEDLLSTLEVRWDFENDGEWDSHFSTSKAAGWIYGVPGDYVVKLEVRDSDGLTGSTTRLLSVTEGNVKPTALFMVDPESGTTNTRFSFDASLSSDEEDDIEDLQVRWDWENDGIWDTELRSIKTITHQFEIAGDYAVMLEVMDLGGYTNSYSKEIHVTNPNTPPIADFTVDPSTGDVNTKFHLDASISSDLEDSIEVLEVRWDWENNEIYDTEFSTIKEVNKQFDQVGTHLVKIQIRDSGGLLSTKVKYIIVN